ncbi:MAG: hypothetical protein IJE78_05055 [Bacteroidaceae bacterium]|nr:hypothetical protein [Bacteroidaceae bacterium]
MKRYIKSSSVRKTRFQQEYDGDLGQYWYKEARREIQRIQDEADAGEILLDENGGAYWRSSGHYLPADCVEKLMYTDFEFDPDATDAGRAAETQKAFEDYRRKYIRPSKEDLAEMRSAFGPGETVVDVLTGNKIRL